MTFWNHVKEAALRYDRRLKTKLRHLKDIEEMKNFDFEEWKAAFLTHFNFKKSRVTDFFKKMDKDADGLVERDDFVNAILNLKLGTSRLEVGCVADKYVQSGDTLLDWREIIASLHPDWDEKVLMSCVKRIEFELNRQSLSCTCQKKFRVFQVGNGKYKVSTNLLKFKDDFESFSYFCFAVWRLSKAAPCTGSQVNCHGQSWGRMDSS